MVSILTIRASQIKVRSGEGFDFDNSGKLNVTKAILAINNSKRSRCRSDIDPSRVHKFIGQHCKTGIYTDPVCVHTVTLTQLLIWVVP